jgi:hypothetical protein
MKSNIGQRTPHDLINYLIIIGSFVFFVVTLKMKIGIISPENKWGGVLTGLIISFGINLVNGSMFAIFYGYHNPEYRWWEGMGLWCVTVGLMTIIGIENKIINEYINEVIARSTMAKIFDYVSLGCIDFILFIVGKDIKIRAKSN